MVSDCVEIDIFQVDAADGWVVGCFVIYFAVCEVNGRGPLGGTWNVGGFTNGMFYADGNIGIIEDVEALEDGFKACRLLLCKKRSGQNGKAEWRLRADLKIPILPQKQSAWGCLGRGGYSSRKKVYVIVSVGELPSESGGIGQYSYGVIVKMGDAVYNFQYCLSVAGVAYVPVDGGSGTGLVQTDNPDGRKGCFNFVDRRK